MIELDLFKSCQSILELPNKNDEATVVGVIYFFDSCKKQYDETFKMDLLSLVESFDGLKNPGMLSRQFGSIHVKSNGKYQHDVLFLSDLYCNYNQFGDNIVYMHTQQFILSLSIYQRLNSWHVSCISLFMQSINFIYVI